jgi:hypothetical protein
MKQEAAKDSLATAETSMVTCRPSNGQPSRHHSKLCEVFKPTNKLLIPFQTPLLFQVIDHMIQINPNIRCFNESAYPQGEFFGIIHNKLHFMAFRTYFPESNRLQ